MALRQCPKCELNYLRGEETLCAICATVRTRKTAPKTEMEPILCSECGEEIATRGGELCETCYLEQKRQAELELQADKIRQNEAEELEEFVDDDDDSLDDADDE